MGVGKLSISLLRTMPGEIKDQPNERLDGRYLLVTRQAGPRTQGSTNNC
jgi:hypothetical protein